MSKLEQLVDFKLVGEKISVLLVNEKGKRRTSLVDRMHQIEDGKIMLLVRQGELFLPKLVKIGESFDAKLQRTLNTSPEEIVRQLNQLGVYQRLQAEEECFLNPRLGADVYTGDIEKDPILGPIKQKFDSENTSKTSN